MHHRYLLVGTFALSLLCLTGCGGDDDDGPADAGDVTMDASAVDGGDTARDGGDDGTDADTENDAGVEDADVMETDAGPSTDGGPGTDAGPSGPSEAAMSFCDSYETTCTFGSGMSRFADEEACLTFYDSATPMCQNCFRTTLSTPIGCSGSTCGC